MSVRRRTWRGPDGSPREAFMIDVQIQLPTGEVRRVREVAPVQGRRAAERYEQQIRARLLLGTDEDARESEVHHDSPPTPPISPTPQPTLTPAATIPTAARGGPRSARRARPTTTPLEGPLASITRPLAPPAATTSTTPTPSATPMLTPTLADFAPRFLEHHRAKGNKPGELRAKDQILTDHLIPAFGALPLDRITARLIDAYKVDKQRPTADTPRPQPKRVRLDRPRKTTRGRAGLAPHTVNNHLTILRSLLHLAARWEMIVRVPAFEMVREDVHDPEFLSFDEARRMVAVAEPEWRIFFITAIGTGLRISELRALRWQDVDLERARIRVARTLTPTGFDVPKSRRPRTVKLGGDIVAALREHPRHPDERACARPRGRRAVDDGADPGGGRADGESREHRPPDPPGPAAAHLRHPRRDGGRAAQRGPELDGALGHPSDPALRAPSPGHRGGSSRPARQPTPARRGVHDRRARRCSRHNHGTWTAHEAL
jgi:integrase